MTNTILYYPIKITHATNFFNKEQLWLGIVAIPVTLHSGRPKWENCFRPEVWHQPGQHSKNASLQKNLKHQPGMVVHACSSNFSGGWRGRIAWAQQFEITVSYDHSTALQPGKQKEREKGSKKEERREGRAGRDRRKTGRKEGKKKKGKRNRQSSLSKKHRLFVSCLLSFLLSPKSILR